MGHFEELDAYVGALADQYRAQGPPTLLYVALTMLGNSALFQGNAEQADQLFDESASLDVPDRTSGDFGALAYRTLVADAANKIAASSDTPRT